MGRYVCSERGCPQKKGDVLMYIKREDAIKELQEEWEGAMVAGITASEIFSDSEDAIYRVPSADVVEGIKCSECEFLRIYNTKDLYARCTKWDINFFPFETDTRTHGCSWGERKDNE